MMPGLDRHRDDTGLLAQRGVAAVLFSLTCGAGRSFRRSTSTVFVYPHHQANDELKGSLTEQLLWGDCIHVERLAANSQLNPQPIRPSSKASISLGSPR